MKHLKGLDHPDRETADILSQFAPEDDDTMERVFRRAEVKYHAKTDDFAESEGGVAPPYKPRRLFAAVVSLALLEHETAVMHDDETDVITLGHRTSRWANPAESMNERGSLLKPLLGW